MLSSLIHAVDATHIPLDAPVSSLAAALAQVPDPVVDSLRPSGRALHSYVCHTHSIRRSSRLSWACAGQLSRPS